MDFIVGLLRTMKKHDSLLVIIDRLTKPTHFLPTNIKALVEDIAKLYIKEIIHLHGIPSLIVSDRDSKFTFHFWRSL